MIDVFVTVDTAYHYLYRKPHKVAEALGEMGDDDVRSVTVLDRSSGLTANCRYEADA